MDKRIKFALEMLDSIPQSECFLNYTEPYIKYRLKYCPYGQCKTFIKGDIIYLKSYETLVAFFDTKTNNFFIKGLYSTTTRKHINAFLQEFAGIISFVPYKPYINKALVNCYTRKIEKIETERE